MTAGNGPLSTIRTASFDASAKHKIQAHQYHFVTQFYCPRWISKYVFPLSQSSIVWKFPKTRCMKYSLGINHLYKFRSIWIVYIEGCLNATKSKTCSADSRTGDASIPATTAAPTPSSQPSASLLSSSFGSQSMSPDPNHLYEFRSIWIVYIEGCLNIY